jgi:hypothetical protein
VFGIDNNRTRKFAQKPPEDSLSENSLVDWLIADGCKTVLKGLAQICRERFQGCSYISITLEFGMGDGLELKGDI